MCIMITFDQIFQSIQHIYIYSYKLCINKITIVISVSTDEQRVRSRSGTDSWKGHHARNERQRVDDPTTEEMRALPVPEVLVRLPSFQKLAGTREKQNVTWFPSLFAWKNSFRNLFDPPRAVETIESLEKRYKRNADVNRARNTQRGL